MCLVGFSAWRGKKPLVRALPAFPPNPSLFVSTPTWPCNIKAQHQPSGIVREWVVFDRLCYKGHILHKSKPRILTPNSEVHFVLLTGSFILLLWILLNFQSKVDRHNGNQLANRKNFTPPHTVFVVARHLIRSWKCTLAVVVLKVEYKTLSSLSEPWELLFLCSIVHEFPKKGKIFFAFCVLV